MERAMILREKEVIQLVGLSRSSIWRKQRLGTFPHRVKLGADGRAVGWRRSDLEAWLKGLGGEDQSQDAEM